MSIVFRQTLVVEVCYRCIIWFFMTSIFILNGICMVISFGLVIDYFYFLNLFRLNFHVIFLKKLHQSFNFFSLINSFLASLITVFLFENIISNWKLFLIFFIFQIWFLFFYCYFFLVIYKINFFLWFHSLLFFSYQIWSLFFYCYFYALTSFFRLIIVFNFILQH